MSVATKPTAGTLPEVTVGPRIVARPEGATACLVLAAAIPDLFADGSSTMAVAGYANMRLGLVALWLRAGAHDKAASRAVGIDLVTQLCRDVLDAGAPGLQFFTLNRSTATAEILGRLRAEA